MKLREIEYLFSLSLHELGEIADRMNGVVTFSINKHINYTNICASKCPICAFQNESGYLKSIDEVVKEALEAVKLGAKELHIVGSHNPDIGIEYFEEIFNEISKRCDATIKALTATEVHYYAKKEGMSVREFLSRLKSAGLRILPGGGAEILSDRVRRIISPNKANSHQWLRVMKIAHELGIKSNATMLIGHVESLRDRAFHLYRLKKLQEKTNGFISFVLLVYHPKNTKLGGEKADEIDILKTIAVSRIVLSNFKGIKAYWVMLGEKLTQVALNYGANDIDGTVMGEKIAHSAGATTPDYLDKEKLIQLIRGAGKIPAERDAYFNILQYH